MGHLGIRSSVCPSICLAIHPFLCRLRSIAAHRDHFVRRLSVCVRASVCPVVTLSWKSGIAMFRKRHMHSSECCHYVLSVCLFVHNSVSRIKCNVESLGGDTVTKL